MTKRIQFLMKKMARRPLDLTFNEIDELATFNSWYGKTAGNRYKEALAKDNAKRWG